MNDPALNQFDPVNAAALCRASAQAYTQSTINDSRTDTHVNVTCADSDFVVAFTGTKDLHNWLTDLDCAWDMEDGARIHRGFARALDSVQQQINDEVLSHNGTRGARPSRAVQDQINEEVFSARREGRRLWLTGHSLGGALAMLYAWRFFARYHECPFGGIYTFGQPRVGNAHFRDLYDFSGLKCRTFRAVHGDDIVPRVPWLLGSYRHAGHEVFFTGANGGNREGKSTLAPLTLLPPVPIIDSTPAQKLPWDIRNAWRELRHGKVALLADHHVDTYLKLFPTSGRGEFHEPLNEDGDSRELAAPAVVGASAARFAG